MKAHQALLLFAAGLGAGWLIPRGASPDSPDVAGHQPAPPVARKHETRPAKTSHESKWRVFARKLPSMSGEERDAFEKSLAPVDRTAAIDALLAQAGPEGFHWATRSMIGNILKAWAGEDFDGSWDWCRQIESDGNRNFVAAQLLNELADKDPDRALALHLEMSAADPKFLSNVPLTLLRKATSTDAGSFLDLLGKTPFGDGSSGTAMEFAADFDFQQAADGLDALLRSQQGKQPPVFPTNFLASWAAREPDAAYAWFSKNQNIPFENFGSLLEGIEKHGVPGASIAWAADKLNEPGAPRDAMIHSLSQIDSSHRATTINAIVQALPDTASRDRFLGDVVTMSNASNPAIGFGFALNAMSSSEARLDVLRRLAERGRLEIAKIPDAQFQTWGLDRQQVEQAANR